MADAFQNVDGLTAQARRLAAVTPADGSDLAGGIAKALYVGAAGNVALQAAEDSSAVTLVGVAAGTILPIRVKRVMSTNTTASSIVALY